MRLYPGLSGWSTVGTIAVLPTAAAAGADVVRGSALGVLLALLLVTVLVARRIAKVPPDIEMSWLSHVEELRRRILWMLATWLVAVAFVFSFRLESRGGWPVPVPAVQDNLAAQLFARIRDDLVPEGVDLVALRPLDGFMAELTVALMTGFLLSLPAIVWHGNRFMAPALRPRERRMLDTALVPVVVLFVAGTWFCYVFVLPFVLAALYGYSTALGAEPLLHLSEFIAFATVLLLTFGIAFQTPMVMYVLARVGIGSPAFYLRYWRHAVVAIIIVAAVVTDPTVLSQLLVAGPLIVLYFLGIGLAALGRRQALAAGGT